MKHHNKKANQYKAILSNPWVLLFFAFIVALGYSYWIDGKENLFYGSLAVAIMRVSIATVIIFGSRLGLKLLFSSPSETKASVAPVPNIDKRSDLIPEPVSSNDTLNSIAGYTEVKRSIEFIIKMLKDPEIAKNANIPKGILLYGPPGTGKTMFARAIAGEVDIPFFSVNASQFTDRLVGQGARNVRNLYAAARRYPVSVVFVDEIDAIGTSRGESNENQEARQTLNALLSELDGFGKDGPIVLTIAATNAFGHLDKALIRPGRFDRKILIPSPGKDDRREILQLHAKGKAFANNIDFEQLALMTENFSCAMLATFVNEAAIASASAGNDNITWEDIDVALTRTLTNGEPLHINDPEERRVTAYHEAGHALAGKILLGQVIAKTTIIGSTSGSMGWTLRVDPDGDPSGPITKNELENSIITLYAGKAAEEFAGYPASAGCKEDLDKASELIRSYFLEYGFGATLVNTGGDSLMANGLSIAAQQLSSRLYNEAVTFLKKHSQEVDAVAAALLKNESLVDNDINKIMEDLYGNYGSM